MKELKKQINKQQPPTHVEIEDIQRVSLVNETMSESNAHINTDHLTTNLSQSSGFGDGPQKRRIADFARSPS